MYLHRTGKSAPTDVSINTDPFLAFSWGNHLVILRVGMASLTPEPLPTAKRGSTNGKNNGRNTSTGKTAESTSVPTNTKKNFKNLRLDFVKLGEWRGKHSIVGLQWVNRQVCL